MEARKWNYEVRHNSSVDQIERAMNFYRVASDFLELIDLDGDAAARTALQGLLRKAMTIAANETKDIGN